MVMAPQITKNQFLNYDDYLESGHWYWIRNKFLHKHPQCFICGKRSQEVHHKTYKNLNRERNSDLLSLCHKCHEKLHLYQRRYKTPLSKTHWYLLRDNMILKLIKYLFLAVIIWAILAPIIFWLVGFRNK